MKILRSFTTLFSLIMLSVTSHADPIAVGAPAPEVTAPDQDGNPVVFSSVYAKGPTLVYFYPRADTPGCTKQACSLRDDWSALQAKGIQVLGVSEDNTKDQKAFKEKYTLPFTLIADADGTVAKAFGVPLNGKTTKRQSFLIKDGKIVWNMLDKTSTATHAKDVMAAVEALPKG